MRRVAYCFLFVTFTLGYFAPGPALAEIGVVCNRSGCRTVNVAPGCKIRSAGIYSWRVCGRAASMQ
jgi:hypothetical protein